MLHYLTAILVSAALFLLVPIPAKAQWRGPERARWVPDDLTGRYVFDGNNGKTFIRRRGRDFLFVNERGARATFAFDGPRRLQLVAGDDGWAQDITATVSWDRRGRRIINFSTPEGSAGRWIQVD
jgi:hypothetical protein